MAFRRLRRPQNRMPAGREIFLKTLGLANQMYANGRAAEAAQLYAELAQISASRGLRNPGNLRRAANLHAQAAHAFADARLPERALPQARQALAQFDQLHMTLRATNFYSRILQKMGQNDMAEAYAQLQAEFGYLETSGAGIQSSLVPTASAETATKHLPTHCPQCGAPLRSDSVDWIDAHRAECPFCGSPLNTLE